MALDAINAIGALAILGPRQIDTQQKVLGTVGAALLPGIVGLAVPLIIAQRATKQPGPANSLVAVPDLVDRDKAEAVASLNRLELKANIITATSINAQKSNVVKQDPPAGTLLSPGATVSIVVGTGVAQPNQSVVPDLTDMLIDEAKTRLRMFQLQLGDVEPAFSSPDLKDRVVGQDPKAETVVTTGSAVSVMVGSGPSEAEVE